MAKIFWHKIWPDGSEGMWYALLNSQYDIIYIYKKIPVPIQGQTRPTALQITSNFARVIPHNHNLTVNNQHVPVRK